MIVPAYDLMSSQADRCKATFVAERASKAGLEYGSYGQSTLYPFVDEKEIVAWKVFFVRAMGKVSRMLMIAKASFAGQRRTAKRASGAVLFFVPPHIHPHNHNIGCGAASFLSSQVWWLVVVLLDMYNSYGGLTRGSIYEEA
eukprot:scaffold26810_cov142-Skeletonema_marinoi.AAC.13